MKKFCLFLIVVVCGLLCGCSRDEGNITEIDVNKVSKIIESKLDNMVTVDNDELKDVYGLDTSSMETVIIKENKDGDLYAIIKCDDIDNTKSIMNEYFKKVKEFNQSYSPERLEILENRVEREIGNYLIYIVSKNAEDIYSDIADSL